MRKVRPESRRWVAPQPLGSPLRLSVDSLLDAVPFVPLPDPKKSAWAILCPSGCKTELIILPEYAGQWVECPTCKFRFLGPHPAQPQMVAEARARAARLAAADEEMAGLLASLAKVELPPEPPAAAKPDKPKAVKLPAKPAAKARPPAKREELPVAELVSEQVQVLGVLEMLAAASQEASKPPATPLAKQELEAASALEKLEKTARRPGGAPPVVPEPPRRAAPPADLAPGDLTPEETVALDALEALAEATIPARKDHTPAAPAGPVPVAMPVAAKKSPSRAAQRLAMGAAPRRKKIQPTKRPARVAAYAVSPAPVRPGHGDLVLTWVVSMAISAAIVGTAFGCGLPDLAMGAIPFVGLAVIRTWKSFQRRTNDGLPY